MFDSKLNTPKKKAFIAMWTNPYDPQVYGTLKLDITQLEIFLKEYSQKVGENISITVYLMKIMGLILAKYPYVNGNIIFGNYVPKQSADVSIILGTEGLKETDVVTLKECDKLSLKDIALKLKEKQSKLLNRTESNHNKRMFFARILPTLYILIF